MGCNIVFVLILCDFNIVLFILLLYELWLSAALFMSFGRLSV